MNFIQRAVYRFTGQAAIRREKRSYDGAKTVARFNDFSKSNLSANAELDLALPVLRNRSRGLYRNDPFVRRWVNQVQTNVVGDGLKFQSRAKNTNGGMDTFGNSVVEAEWVKWSEKCTADGLMPFREANRMVMRSWARDGECFAEIITGPQFTHGMALHFFEADLVDETLNVTNRSGNKIRQGVEVDKFERPVAYHVLRHHPGDPLWNQVEHRKYRRIPASKVIHVFIKDRPHQVRGEPPMSSVMTATKMLGGYREAEVTGRRLAASKMGFFKKIFKDGQGDITPLATDETSDGQLEMEINPGQLTSLPPGVDFEKLDMTTFSTDYEQFERQILRSISAGLDLTYSSLTLDSSGTSYSTDRSDQNKQRDIWRNLQKMLIEQFADKVRAKWFTMVFQFGNHSLPARSMSKFLAASYFTARGWAWVDPEKEIKAAGLALDRKITSLTRIAAEQGRDVEEIFREIKADEDLAKQFGIDLTPPKEKKVDKNPETK